MGESMKEGLLSVIMPVYNSEKYLSAAIESVLNQSYTNIELIIVNDGSIDGSEAICQSYADKDSRIHLISHENRGGQVARNEGLKLAKGELIAFVDSDDILYPDMFKIMIDNMNYFNTELSACEVTSDLDQCGTANGRLEVCEIEGNDKVMASVVGGRSDVPRTYGYLWNKIYRKSMLEGSLFDENINIGEDGLFNILLLKKCNSVAYTNRKMYFYRQYGKSLTNTHTRAHSLWEKEVKAYTHVLETEDYDKVQHYCKRMLTFCYLKKAEAIIREKRNLKELYLDKKELKKLGKVNLNNKNATIMYKAYMNCMPVFIAYKWLYLKVHKLS